MTAGAGLEPALAPDGRRAIATSPVARCNRNVPLAANSTRYGNFPLAHLRAADTGWPWPTGAIAASARASHSAALGTSGAVQALVEGRVIPSGRRLDISSFTSLPPAFRRMVRGLEFDICEMAISTYLCARGRGVPITALPIFPMRGFHHGALLVRRGGGITAPKQLEGRSVGLDRGYTVTTGVWARGILSDQYGVDLSTIDWVVAGDEHVADFTPPARVRPIAAGASVRERLQAGELAAAIGIDADDPDIVPLIADASGAARMRFRDDGHYPINHLIVVRDALLDDEPELALELMEAFHRAKTLYLAELKAGLIAAPDAADRRNAALARSVADPLPYGIAPNRAMLAELVRHAAEQGIIERVMPVETLFASATLGWAGA